MMLNRNCKISSKAQKKRKKKQMTNSGQISNLTINGHSQTKIGPIKNKFCWSRLLIFSEIIKGWLLDKVCLLEEIPVLQILRRCERDISSYYSFQTYVVRNICFCREIRKIIFELSSLPPHKHGCNVLVREFM